MKTMKKVLEYNQNFKSIGSLKNQKCSRGSGSFRFSMIISRIFRKRFHIRIVTINIIFSSRSHCFLMVAICYENHDSTSASVHLFTLTRSEKRKKTSSLSQSQFKIPRPRYSREFVIS